MRKRWTSSGLICIPANDQHYVNLNKHLNPHYLVITNFVTIFNLKECFFAMKPPNETQIDKAYLLQISLKSRDVSLYIIARISLQQMKLDVIFWKSTGKCHKVYSSVTVIQLHVDSKPAAPSFIIGKQILSAAFALDSQQRRNHQICSGEQRLALNNLYCKFDWILFTTVMTLK